MLAIIKTRLIFSFITVPNIVIVINYNFTLFSCCSVSSQMYCLVWLILSIALSTSEALRDHWDRRDRKVKIIIIYIIKIALNRAKLYNKRMLA